MSFSDSEEDEGILLLEARRADHSPPRKKRKLNNRQSQPQNDTDTDTSSSTESGSESHDEEEKAHSDKENLDNTNNKKRRRPSTQTHSKRNGRHRNSNHSSQSLSTQNVYQFGTEFYDEPLSVNPGALVRLELINFLCHSNFKVSFHPNINIIYGQNGSGKSAIEAGISMALGISAKKTKRANKVADIIRFGQDFARVRLFLHNRGPEALPEYGSEICIERKLTKSGKNGSSSFKVLDSGLKTLKSGAKAVREIADKLNIHVDNPCVVLQQSVAKEFLNSTRNTDKFKFFMQASKLGDYEKQLNEAMDNVHTAKDVQKRTKNSFTAIKEQYNECKRNYDALNHMEEQEKLVLDYKKTEKYWKYHDQNKKVIKYKEMAEKTESNIKKGTATLTQQREKMNKDIAHGKILKKEVQEHDAKTAQYKEPVNALKAEQIKLDAERKQNARNISAKTKFVDRAKRKIRDLNKELKNVMNAMKNDEKGRKLADIAERLNSDNAELQQCRLKLPELEEKSRESIQLKQNQQKLENCKTELQNKKFDIRNVQSKLNQCTQKRNRSELFCSYQLRRNRVSVKDIKQLIQYHRRKFHVMPVGPIGEYIQVNQCEDSRTQQKNSLVIQAALGDAMNSFLVSDDHDSAIFTKIIKDRFKINRVSCTQFPHSTKMYTVNENPFGHYKPNDKDGPLHRISDLFTIKNEDNNGAWVYNALLTLRQFERVFCFGTIGAAGDLLKTLNQHKSRYVNGILTYQERNGIWLIVKRGNSISSNPQNVRDPILSSDTSQLKQYYQNKLNELENEKQTIENNMNHLREFVHTMNADRIGYEKQYNRTKQRINRLENDIDNLTRQKSEIEEEDDNNELEEQLNEIQNNIKDEQCNISSLQEEIAPYQAKEEEFIQLLAQKKLKMHDLKQQLHEHLNSYELKSQKFQNFIIELERKKKMIEKIPTKLERMEQELTEQKEIVTDAEKILSDLHGEALECGGEELTPQNFAKNKNNRNRPFKSLREVVHERKQIEAYLEEWKNNNQDPDEIRKRFEQIQPKYENHQEKVRQCNNNVDNLNIMLRTRRKEFEKMKEFVSDQLSTEFRYVMRQQGHDGTLKVNFDTKQLDLRVHMSSHDGSTQVVNAKTLSGGERSFTQVALIMALQKFSGSPMCIYDEFDVFMDSVNRGNSIKILLKAALGETDNKNKNKNKQKRAKNDRQYIFITPNDVSPIIAEGHKGLIKILKLKPPRPNAN